MHGFRLGAIGMAAQKVVLPKLGGASFWLAFPRIATHCGTLAACVFVQAASPSLPGWSIAASDGIGFAVTTEGKVKAWGNNGYASLGINKTYFDGRMDNIAFLPPLKSIAVGISHSMALAGNGQLYTWGENHYAQLGNGNFTPRPYAEVVNSLNDVRTIAAGALHSLALTGDGTIYAWGGNIAGATGQDPKLVDRQPNPTPVLAAWGKPVAVVAGVHSSYVLSEQGEVWAWGYNAYSQLGNQTTSEYRITPERVTHSDGSPLRDIVALSAHFYHALALDKQGQVWSWGINQRGVIGDGSEISPRKTPYQIPGLSNIVSVATGLNHSAAIDQDGRLYIWGGNDFGELGFGDTVTRMSPTLLTGIPPVRSVELGSNYTFVIYRDGRLASWGRNVRGQLGTTGGDRATPAVVATEGTVRRVATDQGRVLAMRDDGTAFAWGNNSSGQIGDDLLPYELAPVDVAALSGVVQVATAVQHAHALKTDGTVWGWGFNGNGRVGSGSPELIVPIPTRIATLPTIRALGAGAVHSFAIATDGTAYSWGASDKGQLCLGMIGEQFTPKAISLDRRLLAMDGGDRHTLLLDEQGEVWTCGANDYGQLGQPPSGSEPLATTPVKVPGLSGITAVVAGTDFSMALDQTGKVWAWGRNQAGQLGNGNLSNMVSPAVVPGLPAIRAIAAGKDFALALDITGQVWGWGSNAFAKLGFDDAITRVGTPTRLRYLTNIQSISAGNDFALAITLDGTLLAWGDNNQGQSGNGTLGAQRSPKYVIERDTSAPLRLDALRQLVVNPDLLPPFYVAIEVNGSAKSLTLDGAINFRDPRLISGNQFAASGQQLFVALLGGGVRKVFASELAFRNNANKWQAFVDGAEIPAYLSGFIGDGEQIARGRIFYKEDLSAYIGADAFIGFGSSAEEMLAAGRYRCLFNIQPGTPGTCSYK